MEKIVASFSGITKGKSRTDDDFLDRLSSRYTTGLLVVFAVVVTVQTYVGSAITCWAPVHFHKSHTKYATSYCWVRNTYYVPLDERLPKPDEPREHVIPYYQWVPFILLLQAFFFYVPSIFWHGLNQKGGVDCDNILESAHSLTSTSKEEGRTRVLKLITNQMHRFLVNRLKVQRPGCKCNFEAIAKTIARPCGRRLGNYLVLLFLFSKILYFANVIGQLFILNSVLSAQYNIYGFEVMKYLSSNEDWTGSPGVVFPRVTFCDLDVRRLGNLHRYTLQCTLPINMYTEKIYMFLWFWMVFVALLTPIGFIVWLTRAILRSDKLRFVRNHLAHDGRLNNPEDAKLVPAFVDNYLAQDGVFVLRLIAHNTNSITVTDVMCSMWDKYREEREKKQMESPWNGAIMESPSDEKKPYSGGLDSVSYKDE